MTMPTTPDSPAAVEYLAERMALDSGVRWRDLFNSERNAWRDRAREIRQAPAEEPNIDGWPLYSGLPPPNPAT